ncbi:hypothetical protein LCGC14_0758440 [marine sediment metagenome]|uniref:Uncharacterized protein n=1 Tax=marine sediment metagenome TaxID=412755 RepID=A0A0F9QLT1_9ZZZZ
MACGIYSRQIREIERAMRSMTRFGIPTSDLGYQKLFQVRSKLLSQVGLKIPRTMSALLKLLGLSPGVIQLWHDLEGGWFVEARVTPKAPPAYHYVDDKTAEIILTGKLDHTLENRLMAFDPYQGE